MQTEDPKRGRSRQLILLLGCIAATLLSVESLTQAMHDHRRVTLDIERGIDGALTIRRDTSHYHLLFAGNSLIFEDLSRQALRQKMGDGYLVDTAGVPGSTYFDWQYGLRSLFARGSQPDVVVFGISPSQFLRASAVTPLPVTKLWRTREVFSYEREERAGLSNLSELMLERYSAFFSLRDTIRVYSRKWVPGYESMVDSWAMQRDEVPAASAAAAALFVKRLSRLQSECAGNSRLIVIVAPTRQAEDAALEPLLRSAALKVGITVIDPIGEMEWPATDFKPDGYHLNAEAAVKFSSLVAADLKRVLEAPTGRLPSSDDNGYLGRSRSNLAVVLQ